MPETAYRPLVTMSATYGSGGSVISRQLAERLGLRFVDRAISVQLSEDAAVAVSVPSQEHLTEAEEAATPGSRILAYFARAASVGAMLAPDPIVDTDDVLRERAEAELRELSEGGPGLVLGRAGAVVLADRPNAFHIRLDGPIERRVEWAARLEGLEVAKARERQARTDRARTLFVKRLYRADPTEPKWYHLILDTTVFGMETSVDLLAEAARAFFGSTLREPGVV